MKKNSTKGYVILGILFALVSITAFAVPTVKTTTFWIAYVFTAAAFAAQIGIWKTALGKEALKSKFIGFPIVHIGIVYAIIWGFAYSAADGTIEDTRPPYSQSLHQCRGGRSSWRCKERQIR